MKACSRSQQPTFASPDVAEAITALGMAIMPVFRESFPAILTAPYIREYTVTAPDNHHSRTKKSSYPWSGRSPNSTAQGQRTVVILEDVMGISNG